MISPSYDELTGAPTCVPPGQIADAAHQTIASFQVVNDLLAAVGNQAVNHGVGQPLAGFQALLKTYQTLLSAAGALSLTAERILELIRVNASNHAAN